MLLVRLFAQILERQHRDRRPVRQGGKLSGACSMHITGSRLGEKTLEQIAALGDGLDLELALAIESLPDVLDALHQRVLGDRDVAPDLVDEFRLADQPAAVAGEIGQYIERFGAQLQRQAGAAQACRGIVDLKRAGTGTLDFSHCRGANYLWGLR